MSGRQNNSSENRISGSLQGDPIAQALDASPGARPPMPAVLPSGMTCSENDEVLPIDPSPARPGNNQ